MLPKKQQLLPTTFLAAIALFFPAAIAQNPDSVTIAGSLQSELGCPEDWQPGCADTNLALDAEDDVWQGIFTLPAGDYEYKAAINGSWDENYGLNAGPNGDNITLSPAAETEIKFYYDHKSNWVTDNLNTRIVTVPGSFQSELGCGEDWQPWCLRSWLQDIDGDGIFTMSTTALPAGSYQGKAAINESWDENYGVGGVAGGDDFNFTVAAAGDTVTFTFDSATNVLTIDTGVEPTEDPGYAIIHYFRPDNDYGDHTTGDFNDFWGLHLWGEGIDPSEVTEWTAPKPFLGESEFGRFAFIKLSGQPGPINFIVHRGDAKDTDPDRAFDPAVQGPENWIVQGDTNNYASQAAAQGYVTIHYRRANGDYGQGTADYWGIHIWSDGGANAIDPAAETAWDTPRPPDGENDFGIFWNVPLNPDDPQATGKPVKFIVHTPSGDNTEPGGNREPGGDREFIPVQTPTIWLLEQDEAVYPSRGAAQDFATLHYRRDDGDYGNFESDDFNDFWGLHVWTGAANPTEWPAPIKADRFDTFGAVYHIDLVDEAQELAYIIHRGDTKDPGPDQILNLFTIGHEVWQLNNADPENPYVYPVENSAGPNPGNVNQQRAYWIAADIIAWDQAVNGEDSYQLHFAAEGGLEATVDGITGGDFIALNPDPAGMPANLQAKFPHLAALPILRLETGDVPMAGAILKSQIAVSALDADGASLNASGLQIPGALDDLYAYDGPLGPSFSADTPSFALWAPTARNVTFHLFDDSNAASPSTALPMNQDNGVWSVTGSEDWNGKYYLYEVEVYVHSTGQVENNFVTDPYSVSLSMNSLRSHILDLEDPAYMPEGWSGLVKPDLAAPEDISIYELHVRDFSITDDSVPTEHRGTFMAFTHEDTDGMRHLLDLQEAGLSHLHLLPVFDIATVDEDVTQRVEPDFDALAAFPSDSTEQQALITASENQDGFNWGYDPFHYNVPEGSYSTDPDGPARVLEFREMVQSLNEKGLRVVMDVVYNHTNASGQNEKSVLDKVVPGYYHRLNDVGGVERSSCCDNTASEHYMMERLMVDSIVLWAKAYKVDAFRFDLMGLHLRSNMEKVRTALDHLTLDSDGIDGAGVFIYGEGWMVGEFNANQRGISATQLDMGGTGIGTFSDRLRDAVRGGGPFDSGEALKNQGFANGLHLDPNDHPQGDTLVRLQEISDWVRVGLAGNLADFPLEDRFGNQVTGSQVIYNSQPAGYTQDPQEIITYISKHDNQTLYDINVYGLPPNTGMTDRVRVQNLGLATVMLAQGVPFFHAGSDMLRSKSMDRDSFNSGDWFNRLDFTYATNNFGVGLPVASKNEENWPVMQPYLADPALVAESDDIEHAAELFRELLQIRGSSPLFRLRTKEEIIDRLVFLNTGPQQVPGLIVMHLSDLGGEDLDPAYESITVLFNADVQPKDFTVGALAGQEVILHPVQADSADQVVRTASFAGDTGTFSVPARTAAVFVEIPPPPTFQDLRDAVQALVDDGTLEGNRSKQLNLWIDLSERFADIGSEPLAAAFLYTFIRTVEIYEFLGWLSQPQAENLIQIAEGIIATLR